MPDRYWHNQNKMVLAYCKDGNKLLTLHSVLIIAALNCLMLCKNKII